jgi:hypothetical protein
VLPTVDAPLRATRREIELLLAKFTSAPVPDPVPLIVNGSAIARLVPLRCTAPPPLTVVAPASVPSAELFESFTIPAVTEVSPVNVLSPDPESVSVADPVFDSPPAPEITPEKVCVVLEACSRVELPPSEIAPA